jgi:2',3'-cyclic-nucleotide 2'-phosphodiesterase
MSGGYDSVIGMAKEGAVTRFWRKVPAGHQAPAEGEATMCGPCMADHDREQTIGLIDAHRTNGCVHAIHSHTQRGRKP